MNYSLKVIYSDGLSGVEERKKRGRAKWRYCGKALCCYGAVVRGAVKAVEEGCKGYKERL